MQTQFSNYINGQAMKHLRLYPKQNQKVIL